MVTTSHTKEDVVAAAGRLFAEHGYHGTSMRELGKELGLLGSSLYSHVESKQDLLVEVVEEGSRLFEVSATASVERDGPASQVLSDLISSHIDVVLDHRDVARTFLNEARMLDTDHRARVLEARDHYEETFRRVLRAGVSDGSFREDIDPKTDAIFILSVLNALERWYNPSGEIGRADLKAAINTFVSSALN